MLFKIYFCFYFMLLTSLFSAYVPMGEVRSRFYTLRFFFPLGLVRSSVSREILGFFWLRNFARQWQPLNLGGKFGIIWLAV